MQGRASRPRFASDYDFAVSVGASERAHEEFAASAARIAASIVERAEEATGLEDFGSDSFREGLEILVRSVECAELPRPEVKGLLYGVCAKALANRLRVVEYVGRAPGILAERVERPLFLIGMPRSGTTLASYLLDQDPARRSLLLWEAWESVPPASTETLRSDPRCLALLAEQGAELARAPDQVRPHYEFANGPTECIRLHAQDFKALMFEGYMPLREYARWMLGADMTSAYAYQKLCLQLLQSRAPGIWSLKMPSHALHIEWLHGVFPDARIVWLQRDPYRALGSLFAMKSHSWQLRCGREDLAWLREHYVGQLAEHVRRPMEFQRRRGLDALYCLSYAELVRDPVGAMRALYAWTGDELSSETEKRMAAWLARNPQGRFGRLEYSLERFGLSVRELEPRFAEYIETYAPEPEGL